MDQPEIPLRSEVRPDKDANLEPQLRMLRSTLTMLLIATCCLGLGLSLYLYRQAVNLNVQVLEAQRVVTEYETNTLPTIKWFIGNLQNFARTNRDFEPILAKYGLMPTNAAPPAAPSARPAMAPAKK
jgi:hypothetical protein